MEALQAQVASLLDRNEYLDERQVALETQNAELRKRVAELEDLLLDAAKANSGLTVETSNLLRPDLDCDVDLDLELTEQDQRRVPTPLRPGQRPRSPAPCMRDDDFSDEDEDWSTQQPERPSTSRGVPQPSPEKYSDYVAESPIGTGTTTSGVVTIDALRTADEEDENSVLRVECAYEECVYEEVPWAEEFMEEMEEMGEDDDMEGLEFVSSPQDAWETFGSPTRLDEEPELERPKTSRKVPQPSPEAFADYVVASPSGEGTRRGGTVTVEELRDITIEESSLAKRRRPRSAPSVKRKELQELPAALKADLIRLGRSRA